MKLLVKKEGGREMLLKSIRNRLFPKHYTVSEYSKIIIERLRNKGAQIGSNVDIINSSIEESEAYLIKIGNNVTITGTTLITHDASMYKQLGYTKVANITIGSNVFIGIGCIILPGVKIGNKVIVGAGTIVSKDIQDNSVVIGNTMRIISTYDKYIERNKKIMESVAIYNLLPSEIMNAENKKIREILANSGIGFVK